MKRIVSICVLLFMAFGFNVRSQNLVPNYSFEKYDTCVNGADEYNGYVSDWIGQEAYGGLGWFTHQCTDTSPKSTSSGVPSNAAGFQYAHSGVSYTEMETFVNGSPNMADSTFPYGHNSFFNARNYIEAKLSDSLQAGRTYYVTFFISLSDSSVYACNDIGAYFSDSALSLNGYFAKSYLTPQVANNPTKKELTDKINWMKIGGSFKAMGGEKYIIIGNFKNDSLSSIRYLGPYNPTYTVAYYYIDDVIVSPDSNYADSIAGVNELKVDPDSYRDEKLKVFPNPSSGKFTFQLIISNEQLGIKNTVEIYNELGQKIYSQFSILNSQFSIDISNQPGGIYFYRVTTEQGELLGSGKIMKE